jgi:hypothetical protein
MTIATTMTTTAAHSDDDNWNRLKMPNGVSAVEPEKNNNQPLKSAVATEW